MKAFHKNQLVVPVFIIISVFPIKTFSQSDSAITYSSESNDSSDYSYHRKYQYLDINLKDETQMFKIAVPTFGITYYNNISGSSLSQNDFGIIISFERKISKSLAVYLENENNYSRTAYLNINYYNFYSILDWGFRYYIFLDKRIKEGVSGNNCNGVYADFLFRKLNGFGYSRKVADENSGSPKSVISNHVFKPVDIPDFRLNLGLQKRLNNFSFLAASFYISYTPEKTNYFETVYFSNDSEILHPKTIGHFSIGLDFKIGLAWGWK